MSTNDPTPDAPRPAAVDGYTAVLCRAATGCGGVDTAVVEQIRAAVAQSTHGVLVTTGCLRQHLHCPHDVGHQVSRAGARLMVQGCTRERTPVGAAVAFGPLTEVSQCRALAAWLADGLRRGHRPPQHLLAVRTSRRPGRTGPPLSGRPA